MYNYSFMDSANLCQFVYGPSWQLIGPAEMAELASAVTGWPLTIADIQQIGERRLNLTRAFNAREGAGREQDTLPKRLFDMPLKGGVSDGLSIPREELDAGAGRLLRAGRLGRQRQAHAGQAGGAGLGWVM